MNVNNDIATTLLACNNNVTSGDKACFFYVTLYQTKHNQKEESFNYHNICLALSRRIKNHQEVLNASTEDECSEEEVAPDFCEGLKRMLASVYGHTSTNVLSSTMAAKLLADGDRFMFSHEFKSIPLKHLIEWAEGNENLEFKLQSVKNKEGDYEHVQDTFINNMIYRPAKLENIGLYDIVSNYELKKMPSKKLNSGNINIESKTTFNLLEEHPSHKYMVMSKRNQFIIPSISNNSLLPNIADLNILQDITDPSVTELRERYAMIVLLLFFPYRDQDDLLIDGSYWEKFKRATSEKLFSQKSLEVIQNIQDVLYNCSKMKQVKDELETTTTFTPHESDSKRVKQADEEETDVNELADMFNQIDDIGATEICAVYQLLLEDMILFHKIFLIMLYSFQVLLIFLRISI